MEKLEQRKGVEDVRRSARVTHRERKRLLGKESWRN